MKLKKYKRGINKRGFTLVELLAVVVLIGIISILTIPKMLERFGIKRAEVSEEAKQLLYLATQGYLENHPNNDRICIPIEELVDTGYLISPVLDVKTNTSIPNTAGILIDYENQQYNYHYTNQCTDETVDIVKPILRLTVISKDAASVTAKINILEAGSGLDDESNRYQYCVNKNKYNATDCVWKNYVNGEPFTFEVGDINYLWAYPVRDKAGNINDYHKDITEPYLLLTYSVDNEKPQLVVSPSSGTYDESGNITITVSDNEGGSGLASTNVYKYCLSTSDTARVNCEWTTYTSGTSFAIRGKDQTKYLWIWPIKDKAGNINGDHINVNTPYVAGIYQFMTTYTITYNLNGGSVATANRTSYNMETETFTLNNPTKTNYAFSGWTGSNGTTPSTSVSVVKGSTGNKTYTANWTTCDVKNSYTYTGTSTFVDDGSGNYRIKFKTSGTLSVNCPISIDVFLVGGGSAGGGGGYTKTVKSITLKAGTNYSIVVGAGGTASSVNGKSSSAFGQSVSGGQGADGGSGAGNSGYTSGGGAGASNGGSAGGEGQGTTTREFGESTGTLYAGGGGGGTGWCYGHCPDTGCNTNSGCYNGGFGSGAGGAGGGGIGASKSHSCGNGTANTGGGAGLGVRGSIECSGGSGIVIIRNHR